MAVRESSSSDRRLDDDAAAAGVIDVVIGRRDCRLSLGTDGTVASLFRVMAAEQVVGAAALPDPPSTALTHVASCGSPSSVSTLVREEEEEVRLDAGAGTSWWRVKRR